MRIRGYRRSSPANLEVNTLLSERQIDQRADRGRGENNITM
jgi:hypothetical protein